MQGQYSCQMALAANSEDSIRSIGPGRDWRWSCVFALLLCLSSVTLVAQTSDAPSAPHSPNRFLFIIETSRAMRPRAPGVFEAMKQALDSSLNGQIHQGDLVGIWTFNDN